MLDPEYLDRAGDMVGAVYGEMEADMLSYLCGLLLRQDLTELGQRGATALNLLSQSAGPELMAFVEAHREDVSRAVSATVEDAVRRSDRADAARIGTGAAEAMAATRPRQVELTVRGIAAVLERDNVDMAQGALDLWNRTVARAVTRVNTGEATADRAVHEAVREMMRQGISTVTYRDAETGRQTVTNRVDVAVRRHVRTQIAQDGMRRTLEVCGEAGIQLVEVSSHGGARPSHARWQGRVYSLNGETEVDGVTYKDFYSETGYGKVDGLGGANCRHSFGPWLPGTPRMYSPDPGHPSGLGNDEVYRLRQGQRRRERDIRQTKRELAGAQLIADRDASLANVAEVERLRTRLARQQAGLRAYIDEANGKGKAPVLQRAPNREWAGDMPRIRKSDASHRTMDEFMGSDGVRRTLRARGVSKTAARKALSEEMARRGVSSRDFSMLSRTSQQGIFKSALASVGSHVPGAAEKRITRALGIRRFVALDGVPASLKKQLGDTAERIASMFPKAKGAIPSIQSKTLTGNNADADAITWPNGKIELNLAVYVDHEAFRERIANEVASGYAPQGCDEGYVFAHEFGHSLDIFLARELGYSENSVSGSIQSDIMQRCGLTDSPSDVAGSVSEYAAEGPHEWFAECIGEAVCSDNPRAVASELLKWVYDQMRSIK